MYFSAAQHEFGLNIGKNLTGIGLIPASVQVLSRNAKLDDQIARQVLGRDLAALLPPQAEKGGFIVAHDDAGIRAADEITAEFLGVRCII
jgi:hypothetical protein